MSRVRAFVDSDVGGLIIGLVLVAVICVGLGLFVAYS
jgi:hypothetical protein